MIVLRIKFRVFPQTPRNVTIESMNRDVLGENHEIPEIAFPNHQNTTTNMLVFYYFLENAKREFLRPSNAFPIILHGDFTDFRERVAQKLLYAVVYWSFSSTFLDIRVKLPKIPTYLLSYLGLFELR